MNTKNINRLIFSLIILLLLVNTSFAQECGPNCPVCSGAGANSGALLAQKSFLVSVLSIPDDEEETTVLNTRVGILNWLDAGFGYAVKTEKVLWNVRTQPVQEQKDGWKPGVIIGTGSVQTGGSDQSLYLQLIKAVALNSDFNLQLSTGVATLLPDFDETFGQAGLTLGYQNRYYAFANYDGESYHEGFSWVAKDWLSLSFILVESETPAFSIVFKR